MMRFNIYQMNLNPCMIDLKAEKSKLLRRIMASVENKYKNVEFNKIRMHSFRPLDNRGYGKYTDFRLDEIEGPAILVVSSLYDLDKNGAQAYARLNYALSLDKIKMVYITNYNPDVDVTKYIKFLDRVFRESKSIRPKRVEVPEELIEAIGDLRRVSPPVMLSDIAAVTGLQESMVRKFASQAVVGAGRGESINAKQAKLLKDALEIAKKREFKRFEIVEEEFTKE